MTLPRLDEEAIYALKAPGLDISMLAELLAVLGTDDFRTAVEKFGRDVTASLRALQDQQNLETQIKAAHRLKGLFYQFGGLRAAGIAERVEMSSSELAPSELKAVVEETRSAMVLVQDAASNLISQEKTNG